MHLTVNIGCAETLELNDCIRNTTPVCNLRQNSVRDKNSVPDKIQAKTKSKNFFLTKFFSDKKNFAGKKFFEKKKLLGKKFFEKKIIGKFLTRKKILSKKKFLDFVLD